MATWRTAFNSWHSVVVHTEFVKEVVVEAFVVFVEYVIFAGIVMYGNVVEIIFVLPDIDDQAVIE